MLPGLLDEAGLMAAAGSFGYPLMLKSKRCVTDMLCHVLLCYVAGFADETGLMAAAASFGYPLMLKNKRCVQTCY
jgi:hypothetical protein